MPCTATPATPTKTSVPCGSSSVVTTPFGTVFPIIYVMPYFAQVTRWTIDEFESKRCDGPM
jgi:hypothetical protein